MSNLIIVDDEVIIATQLEEKLSRMGFTILGVACNGEEAVQLARKHLPDLMLMDIVMPGPYDGIAAASIIRKELDIPTVFLTAFSNDQLIARAKESEPLGYILKPYNDHQIRSTLELALYKCEMDRRMKAYREELENQVAKRTQALSQVNQKLEKEIQDRMFAQAALEKQMKRNDLILKTAMDGFWITDEKGTVSEANAAVAAILGYLPEEVIGKRAQDFETNPKKSVVLPQLKKAVETGSVRYEARFFHKAGQEVELDFRTNHVMVDNESCLFTFFHNISLKKQAMESFKQREAEYRINIQNLKEVNTALKVLIKKRDAEKAEIEEKILFNVKEMILPYIKKLKESNLDEKQATFAGILESNVKDILSPFSPKLTSRHFKLTPTELQIAKLVRMGITSREIAEIMGLSRRTVESHRDRIRKKVGLNKKKRNLRTFLMSLE